MFLHEDTHKNRSYYFTINIGYSIHSQIFICSKTDVKLRCFRWPWHVRFSIVFNVPNSTIYIYIHFLPVLHSNEIYIARLVGSVCFLSVKSLSSATSGSRPLKVQRKDPIQKFPVHLCNLNYYGRYISLIPLLYPTSIWTKIAIKRDRLINEELKINNRFQHGTTTNY